VHQRLSVVYLGGDAGGGQQPGVPDAVIAQRVIPGDGDVGRRQIAQILRAPRRHVRRRIRHVDFAGVPTRERSDGVGVEDRRDGVFGERRQRRVPHGRRIPQQLEHDRRSAVVARPLRHRGGDGAAGRIPGHGDPGRIAVQFGSVLGDPKRCGPSVFDGGGVGVLGGEPVVDGYHDRVGAHRVLTRRAVVGFEVADDEAAAVKIQQNGRGDASLMIVGIAWRPIDPERDGARGAGDRAVLDPQLGMQRPARQVAEPLACRADSVLSG
jgi:hypothetical protein